MNQLEQTKSKISQHTQPPHCLADVVCEAWEGGGMLGHAYGPIIETLNRYRLKIIHHAGTSAGGIIALLRSMGYTSAMIKETQETTDWSQWTRYKPSAIYRLIVSKGWHSISTAENWLGDRVVDAFLPRNVTFKQLKDRGGHSLYVIATRWENSGSSGNGGGGKNAASPVLFSPDSTPDVPIRLAVLASMAVPIFWPLVEIDGWYFSDGGIVCNHPLHVFKDRPASEVIGVRLDTENEINLVEGKPLSPSPCKPKLAQIIAGAAGLMMDTAQKQYIPEQLWSRIIRIDVTGEKSLDFSSNGGKVSRLRKAGEKAIQDWITKNKEQL